MRSPVLEELYRVARERPSDINEHVPTLYRYASTCRHITEFGTRAGVSTAAFLYAQPDFLCCYDVHPSNQVFELEIVANTSRTGFAFYQEDVLKLEIEPTDLLFIDTLHTYDQMRQELALHGNKTRRYLIFHDTETFGEQGEMPGTRGIWPAIAEFLRSNEHWRITQHFTHNHGLTVLTRLS
ncbi:MAG: class I SAM-dependent methyltransferase [Pirellulales bacterium]